MLYQEKLLQLCMKLLSCPSVTPTNAGAIEVVEEALSQIGYDTHKLVFDDTTNLYAKIGDGASNLCFAGHTDVVPAGDSKQWRIDPFKPQVIDGTLYGRGTVDMKAAICAFIIASDRYLEENSHYGAMSIMITGDEEASGKNGTPKILQWLEERNEHIDFCIVGEPTSDSKVGDTIKIGRRGSITFQLTILGQQGHVAYPQLAVNPIRQLTAVLQQLQHHQFDVGNEFFQPSNLEVTTIDVGNQANNVIPAEAFCQFNIRFNNIHTAADLEKCVRKIISDVTNDYQLQVQVSAHPFITSPGILTEKMTAAIENISKIKPTLSTSGGTSDARHIKPICPVIEFGLLNSTAHKVDESAPLNDIYLLSEVYYQFLRLFFRR